MLPPVPEPEEDLVPDEVLLAGRVTLTVGVMVLEDELLDDELLLELLLDEELPPCDIS